MPTPLLLTSLVFVLLMGLCVGSFLNVVVYRLPLGKSLIHPPSTCPKCGTRLAWFDNIPVLGWIKLGGKCRYCALPISPRYPVVEAVCGVLFLGYAAAVFVWGLGPWTPTPAGFAAFTAAGLPVPPPGPEIGRDWPMLLMHLLLLAALLAASLIDLDTFTIPISLPVFMAVVGLAGHAGLMDPAITGQLHVAPGLAMPALLASAGWVGAFVLLQLKVLPLSFPQGEPMLLDHAEWEKQAEAAKAEGTPPPPEPVHWTRGMINREVFKEILFCALPLAGFVAGFYLPSPGFLSTPWVQSLLGSALGGLVGGGVLWAVRILGSLGFGKVAMGLGDVHLMAGVGCVVGGTVAGLAVFPAAIWGLLAVLFVRNREVPFGPHLALGTLTLMLFAQPLWETMLGLYRQYTGG